MKATANSVLLAAVMAAGIPMASADTGRADRSAIACFKQTERIGKLGEARRLSPEPCDQALQKGPYTDEHRASVLFNRALIEQANGDSEIAMLTFDAALALDPSLVKAKLARAQLAHRLGDYATAIIGYAELLDSHRQNSLVQRHQKALERNLGSARSALSVVVTR